MATQQTKSITTIILELKKLQQEKVSGTMVFVDEKKHMAKVSLAQGQIVGSSFGNKSGMEALELLRQSQINWFQFIKAPANPAAVDANLPSTTEILSFLEGAPTNPTSVEPEKKSTTELLSQQTLALLKATLAEFMGPAAPMICNKALRQGRDLNSVIELLAHEIPDKKQSVEFKDRVWRQLR